MLVLNMAVLISNFLCLFSLFFNTFFFLFLSLSLSFSLSATQGRGQQQPYHPQHQQHHQRRLSRREKNQHKNQHWRLWIMDDLLFPTSSTSILNDNNDGGKQTVVFKRLTKMTTAATWTRPTIHSQCNLPPPLHQHLRYPHLLHSALIIDRRSSTTRSTGFF